MNIAIEEMEKKIIINNFVFKIFILIRKLSFSLRAKLKGGNVTASTHIKSL